MAVAAGEAQPLILILVRRVPLVILIQADRVRRVPLAIPIQVESVRRVPLVILIQADRVRRVPLAIPIQADHARRVIHATRIPKMCCTSNDATTIVCLALTMREYCIPAYFALF